MCIFIKLFFCIIFSPAILVISIKCFFNNLKLKYCRKKLLCNLNLEILDKLNLNEFTEIILILLKIQKIKVLKIINENENNIVIVAYKKHKRILINIANSLPANAKETLVNINSESAGFVCDQKILISKSNFSQKLINEAIKFNIKIFNLYDIEEILLNYKKII